MSRRIANRFHYRHRLPGSSICSRAAGPTAAREKGSSQRLGRHMSMDSAVVDRRVQAQAQRRTNVRETAVRFENVSMAFDQVRALDGVNFQIKAGETVALLGPNGAGKSTAIAIMLGLLHPTDGNAEIFGIDPQRAVESGRIGAMLQTGALLQGAKVREL